MSDLCLVAARAARRKDPGLGIQDSRTRQARAANNRQTVSAGFVPRGAARSATPRRQRNRPSRQPTSPTATSLAVREGFEPSIEVLAPITV